MFKKNIFYFIFIVTLFSLNYDLIVAYEFKNDENKYNVYEKINEIYDSKNQYEDLVGQYVEKEVTVYDASSSSYWWPIGSSDTVNINEKTYAKGDPETVRITSPFGYRDDPFNRGRLFHNGLDISGGSGLGSVNIIAAKAGVVVYPTANVSNNCPSGSSLSNCGGGYGNYVVIQHSDGNYTLYGHLYENSIRVKAGDSVEQGQVIGKMGSSGNSTGAHLHFEIREGENSNKSCVDPLLYISVDNPRAVYAESDFLLWLNSWEGHTKIKGSNYVVENIGDGVRTVGAGVTLENNVGRFAQHGIDVNDYPVGSEIPISIVDQIELEEISNKRTYVENILSKNSIMLDENQIQALISQTYNIGNIKGFADAYLKDGNSDAFYNNWFFRAIMKGTKFEKGLTRRRNSEWSLFHNGEYVLNG